MPAYVCGGQKVGGHTQIRQTAAHDHDVTENNEHVSNILAAAVRIAVGSDLAKPRTGQAAFATDVSAIQSPLGNTNPVGSGRGHIAGLAGVGVGKSFLGLSNAGYRAVKHGERTLYSTKGLPLQAQIVEKDAGIVSQATVEVLGKGFTVAVHKGWANYACTNRAFELATNLLGEEVFGFPGPSEIRPLMKRVERLPNFGTVKVDGAELELKEMKPLALWALQQALNDSASADKDTYEGEASDQAWKSVSVSPEECVGFDECPFAEMCKSDRARSRAAAADVVVTNHSLLAVQASKGVPIVLGNATLGMFDHIIVDEAHELPKVVRSQGECSVSGRRLGGLIRLVSAVTGDHSEQVTTWADQGRQVAEMVEAELHHTFTATSSGEVGRLGENDDPLKNTGDGVIGWARIANRLIKKPVERAQNNGQMGIVMAGKRAVAGIDALVADVQAVRKHHKGQARWMAPPPVTHVSIGRKRAARPWYTAQAAPVEVGGLLRANLWTQEVEDEDTGEMIDVSPSVTCMSGTLPPGFVFDAGLNARSVIEYEMPFPEAYAESMLFVPSAKSDQDIEALTDPGYGGKRRFSTAKHRLWALEHMKRLIAANGGHALVLSATTGDGKKYADELREHAAGRWNVYTQWDEGSARINLARWKKDSSGILVGTQSLMTGVDAPGETCSLVILDRPPRAAGNAVDDARVELIADRLGGGQAAMWTGKRLVYVADAVEKMGQSRGRLVRGQNDRGVFAVLDPRLLKNHSFSYEAMARADMMKCIDVFGNKTSDIVVVEDFITRRKFALAA
jgi:ATP-dependent DNA helicase DinG